MRIWEKQGTDLGTEFFELVKLKEHRSFSPSTFFLGTTLWVLGLQL
jgi:hypothetical protein